jgi:predicted methyltransferase
MTKAPLVLAVALVAAPLVGCEEARPPVAPPPSPPPAQTAAAPVEAAPPAPPEPTPEEKKKAEEAKKKAEEAQRLVAARAKWEEESKAEEARWTADLRAETKKLVSGKYATLKAALGAVLKGNHRKPGNAARDAHRHPLETLEFFGLKTDMNVLEYDPGGGWYTELLAPTLASRGKLTITMPEPNGPAESFDAFYGARIKRFLDTSPELYGKVERMITLLPNPSGPVPKLGADNTFDMVLVCRLLHELQEDKMLSGFLSEVFRVLKPGGVLGIEQHRAQADANPDESAKQGYLPEAFVIRQAEEAGFTLAGKSEINANPKDTKDYPKGVWTLPPTFTLKDQDRAKYAAIGESDRMTLKLVKPKKK